MRVELRPFDECDLPMLEMWAFRIRAGRYMSRVRPLDPACRGHAPAAGVLWFVIIAGGRDVGAIWLERESADCARVGMLLGDESLFGRGIGSRALALAIERAGELSVGRVSLHVRAGNGRAIACYAKCGFVAVCRGVKSTYDDGGMIEYLRMELRLGAAGAAPSSNS
jgi:RimJ/RimL family protein N-acetyltransferase